MPELFTAFVVFLCADYGIEYPKLSMYSPAPAAGKRSPLSLELGRIDYEGKWDTNSDSLMDTKVTQRHSFLGLNYGASQMANIFLRFGRADFEGEQLFVDGGKFKGDKELYTSFGSNVFLYARGSLGVTAFGSFTAYKDYDDIDPESDTSFTSGKFKHTISEEIDIIKRRGGELGVKTEYFLFKNISVHTAQSLYFDRFEVESTTTDRITDTSGLSQDSETVTKHSAGYREKGFFALRFGGSINLSGRIRISLETIQRSRRSWMFVLTVGL